MFICVYMFMFYKCLFPIPFFYLWAPPPPYFWIVFGDSHAIITGWPWIFYGLEWASCLPSGCLGTEIVVRYHHRSLLSWAWAANTGFPLKRIARGLGQQVENTHGLHRARKVDLNSDRPCTHAPWVMIGWKRHLPLCSSSKSPISSSNHKGRVWDIPVEGNLTEYLTSTPIHQYLSR